MIDKRGLRTMIQDRAFEYRERLVKMIELRRNA